MKVITLNAEDTDRHGQPRQPKPAPEPPNNQEYEQAVLGALLVSPENMGRVMALIEPDDFYRTAHGRIYQAMLDLYGRNEPVDLVTVSGHLKGLEQLESVGGPVFLAGLSEAVGFAYNAEHYAGKVKDLSDLRKTRALGLQLANAKTAKDAEPLIAQLERITHEEAPGATLSNGVPIWPHEVMAGAAGRFALAYAARLETPASFLYVDYMTLLGHVVSSAVCLRSELKTQPRLYTVNLGESADARKSTAIKVTADHFLDVVVQEDINPIWGVGSAEGLQKALKEKNGAGILIYDELKALVQKMRIDASVLLACVNTLFESNRYHSRTLKTSVVLDNAELSMLAASTLDTYRSMFTGQFLNIGFINRLFVVIGDSQRKFSIPEKMPAAEKEPLKEDLRQILRHVGSLSAMGRYEMPIEPAAKAIFDEWYFSQEPNSDFTRRLDTYGLRLMPLMAVNELQQIITPEIATRTVALLNYQLAARKYADPIDADNEIAKVEERIRRLLAGGPMKKRELEKRGAKHRVGIYLWEKAIGNLQNADEIRLNYKTKIYQLVNRDK